MQKQSELFGLLWCLTGGLCWLEELVTKQELWLSNQMLLLMRDHKQLNNRTGLNRFKWGEERRGEERRGEERRGEERRGEERRRGLLSGHSSVCECLHARVCVRWWKCHVLNSNQKNITHGVLKLKTCFQEIVFVQFLIKLSFLSTI